MQLILKNENIYILAAANVAANTRHTISGHIRVAAITFFFFFFFHFLIVLAAENVAANTRHY